MISAVRERAKTFFGGKSVKRNYFYNVLFKIFTVIVPIITTPYITGVLGAESYGQYSYVSSYVVYFTLFAGLGFARYGERLIASHRGDKKQQSIDFWELTISRSISVLIALGIYYLLACFNVYGEKYTTLFYIRGLSVLGIGFSFLFFFYGEEEFGKTFIFSAISKIISVILIFSLVKSPADNWIYALIIEIELIVSTIFLIPFLAKKLTKVGLKEIHFLRHFKATIILFLPTVATALYPVVDKTIIGLITKQDAAVGVYNKAQQLIDAVSAFILSIGLVVAPRNSYLFANNKIEEANANIEKSFSFVWAIGFPMVAGTIAIASHLCTWYLPNESFKQVPIFLYLLSPIIVLAGIHNIIGIQYLIPTKKDIYYLLSSILALIINVALTVVLTFLIGFFGAAIGSTISELFTCIFLILITKKKINYKSIFSKTIKYLVSSALMGVCCFALSKVLSPTIINTFVIIAFGVLFYSLCLYLL